MEGNKNIKQCVGCKEIKPKNLKTFRKNQNICIKCEEDDVEFMKECSRCKEEKSSTLFRLNRKYCLDCERTSGRNYRRTNNKASIWVENNKEKMSELQHNHYEKHKAEIRATESDRFANDPSYRKIKSYRAGANKFVSGIYKTSKNLDVTYEVFKGWLLFCHNSNPEDNMNMANYGEIWQIDHVIPLNTYSKKKCGNIIFEESDELPYIFRWYNICPILSKTNLTKNKYIDKPYMIAHINRLDEFLRKTKNNINNETYLTYRKIFQLILDD